jgi:hypothetical protein
MLHSGNNAYDMFIPDPIDIDGGPFEISTLTMTFRDEAGGEPLSFLGTPCASVMLYTP